MSVLGRQPLFQLLGAMIVLLVADWRPGWGAIAAVGWVAWVWYSYTYSRSAPSNQFAFHK